MLIDDCRNGRATFERLSSAARRVENGLLTLPHALWESGVVKNRFFERKVTRALTLIELLAVLTILALVVGIAGPAIYRQVTQGRARTAEAQIAGIEKSLNSFYLDCGFFPSSLEDLINEPTEGRSCPNYDPEGYFERGGLPADPWGNPYIYQAPGEVRTSSYDLYSAGSDGEPGTEDDITNWE